MYVYIHINFTSFPTYTTHQFAGWFCFFSHLERSMALQIPMAGVMPDILERVLFGGLERLGRKGWGMEGETKKPMALKEAWSRSFFFSKANHFFIQQHSSICFPRLAIPHKKYKTWHVGASNKLPWGPTKLTKEGFFSKLHL